MNNFEKYTFIKEKLNAPRFDNEDEEIDWFTKHLYGLYNQASRLREENNNYIARIDKQKEIIDKIKEYIDKYESIRAYYEYLDGEYWETDYDDDFKEEILELLEEIE